MGEAAGIEGPPLPFDRLRTRLTAGPYTVPMLSWSKHASGRAA